MTQDIPQLNQQVNEADTKWKLCIIFQKHDSTKTLVSNPRIDSYQLLLVEIQERANLQDSKFVDIQGMQ